MLRRRIRIVPLLALAASACTWGGPDRFSLLAVTPGEALNDADIVLSFQGGGFAADPVKVDFDQPDRASPGGGFTAALVAGAARVPLGPVTALSGTELHATLAARAAPGVYDVELRDANGNVATLPAAFRLMDLVAVTTAIDESDAGATPVDPKGNGLSLREAIAWVNGRATPTVIRIATPPTLNMTAALPALTAPGARVVGVPGAVLDFGGINPNCFTLGGPDQRLSNVTLRGCNLTFVDMSTGSGGSQVSGVTFDTTGTKRYGAWGVLAQAASTAWSRIGPGNDLSGLATGIYVKGARYEIVGNTLHDNGAGVALKGGITRVRQNTFANHYNNLSNKGVGVSVASLTAVAEILHNTFHANGGNAVDSNSAASLTVRDNLFTGNAGYGVSAPATGTQLDHNGYFANVAGDVAPPLSPGSTDVLQDPLYVNAAAGDYHLQATSPVIDKGIDTGLDVNGGSPGPFNGAAPDLGAFETP